MARGEKINEFGKFVRLNSGGEIVEVVSVDSTEITVKYYGKNLTMKHREVSLVTPEEAVAASQVDKRVFIFQHYDSGGPTADE